MHASILPKRMCDIEPILWATFLFIQWKIAATAFSLFPVRGFKTRPLFLKKSRVIEIFCTKKSWRKAGSNDSPLTMKFYEADALQLY